MGHAEKSLSDSTKLNSVSFAYGPLRVTTLSLAESEELHVPGGSNEGQSLG